jgi:drug/metabolite transporter (DMT)-like permease
VRAPLSPGALGTLYMIAGGFLLTCQDAISKWLTADYHAGEIIAYRGIWTLIPVLVVVFWRGDLSVFRPRRPAAVAWRSLFTLITSVLVVLSFRFLPLSDALAIIFLNPLIVTALSVPMLGEPVGWRRWSAVGVGFLGVVLMTRPGYETVAWVVAVPLAAALFAALRDATTRKVGLAESTLCLLIYSTVLTVIGGFVTLPFGTHMPPLADWGLFVAAGLLAAGSHVLMIRAFQIANAATVAPFKYLNLVWAASLGYIFWGDVPDGWRFAGAGLVVASGLYVLHRETMLARRARAAG